jgi:hypothetical protein
LTLSADNGSFPPELAQVRTVYLMPMGNGLDQFLAHQLTRHGVFKVTTDPAKADAFFSDVVGLGFENRLAELLPKVEEKSEEPESRESKRKKEEEAEAAQARVLTFGRSKGNVFLIDGRTRQVLWTAFDIPKNTRSEQIHKMSERLVARLRKDLGQTK